MPSTEKQTNKLGEITFANRPSAYDKFMADVKSLYGDLQPIFGLGDTRGFGRNFASLSQQLALSLRLAILKGSPTLTSWLGSAVWLLSISALPERAKTSEADRATGF